MSLGRASGTIRGGRAGRDAPLKCDDLQRLRAISPRGSSIISPSSRFLGRRALSTQIERGVAWDPRPSLDPKPPGPAPAFICPRSRLWIEALKRRPFAPQAASEGRKTSTPNPATQPTDPGPPTRHAEDRSPALAIVRGGRCQMMLCLLAARGICTKAHARGTV